MNEAIDAKASRVLERLEREDAEERARTIPRAERARQIPPSTGRFLCALVVSKPGCKILEIGGSKGYSSIWLAAAAAASGGSVVSLEHDPLKIAAWRANVAEAGLGEHVELVEGDAFETIPALESEFDLCFLDAEKEDYERLFALTRSKMTPGGVVVADNVVSHEELGAYTRARQSDRTLISVTLPLDHGLELSVILSRSSRPLS
jgi:predicted O-methyltransferase YrrM